MIRICRLDVRAISAFLLCFLCSNALSDSSALGNNVELEKVSIYTLLSAPSKYEGKRVRLVGVLDTEFEGTALYASFDDYDYKILRNALFLDLDDLGLKKLKACTSCKRRTYVSVDGFFNSVKGHFDLFSGTIEKISSIRKIPSREQWDAIKRQGK